MSINIKSASKAITIGASILCLGGVLSFFRTDGNQKAIALNVIVASTAIAFSSHTTSKLCQDSAEHQVNDLVNNHKREVINLGDERDKFRIGYDNKSKLLDSANKSITEKDEQLKLKEQLISTLKLKLVELQKATDSKLAELDAKLSAEDNRIAEFVTLIKSMFHQSLQYRIDKDYERLAESSSKLAKNPTYGNIQQQLLSFYQKLHDEHSRHYQLLGELSAIESKNPSDLVVEIVELYFQISDEIAALKVKYRNILNLDERATLDAALEELAERRDTKKFIPYPKASAALDNYHDFQKDQLANIQIRVQQSQQEFEKLKAEVGQLIAQIEQKNEENAQLKQQISKLNEPLRWTLAISRELEIGNLIINYFWQSLTKRIYLDRSHASGDIYTVNLYYQIDRNSRAIKPSELNEHSEALQQFCRVNKPIIFKWDAEKALMVAEVELKSKPKKESAKDDIDKIWIPATKFENYVKRWERVRITAGSTGGKSPTAKNLALAIMNSRKGKGEIRLYDPQHGSKKDFWNMPKAGTSHEDNIEGMEELCELLDTRSQTKGNHPFILYLFDEIDSTIAKHRGDANFKDLVVYSLSQGSHQDLGVIYIGQSADANTIPGMSHSQWNNAVQLHIGSNAGIWIDKATTITNEDKTKLLNQYRMISEYCDRQNQELGLDIYTDAGAYRFALAVPLTGLPKFIQLPAFDSYDYNEVMSTNTQSDRLGSKSEGESKNTEKQFLKLDIKCPYCGSANCKRDGKDAKGQQLYSCKDCDTRPKKWRANNSTNSN